TFRPVVVPPSRRSTTTRLKLRASPAPTCGIATAAEFPGPRARARSSAPPDATWLAPYNACRAARSTHRALPCAVPPARRREFALHRAPVRRSCTRRGPQHVPRLVGLVEVRRQRADDDRRDPCVVEDIVLQDDVRVGVARRRIAGFVRVDPVDVAAV